MSHLTRRNVSGLEQAVLYSKITNVKRVLTVTPKAAHSFCVGLSTLSQMLYTKVFYKQVAVDVYGRFNLK